MAHKDNHGWVIGKIVKGDNRGRSLGFPTANVVFDQGTTQPQPAIYAAWAKLLPDATLLPAVIHVGPRPTFPGSSATFEVHLIRFPDQDLYDRQIAVLLVRHLRLIESFRSPEALSAAIAQDVTSALEILQP